MAQNASLNDSLPTPPKTKKHTWISLWFLFAMPIMLWDAGFCFMRPRSMVGGDLHFLWAPYTLQQEVDLLYSAKTYEEGGGFTNAQALMNLVETALSFVYLLGKSGVLQGRFKKVAELLGFLSAGMTFGKTVLYWAQAMDHLSRSDSAHAGKRFGSAIGVRGSEGNGSEKQIASFHQLSSDARCDFYVYNQAWPGWFSLHVCHKFLLD
ncbi:hypothetical protein VNI00_007645 [Paramarasmius palmivorus]|uniref:Uncharacterized protein n=1 Tax=Paramarasmius palmivorus TaxID=297713 RepID=A0AAW0D4P8_9AGAR